MKLSVKEPRPFHDDAPGMFRFAAENGCAALHIHLPDNARLALIKQAMRETGVGVASVGAMSCKMLGPNLEEMAHEHRQVERALAIASELGAPTVSNFLGHDPTKSFQDNIATFAKVYEPHARIAERLGVAIAFENCPMFGGIPAVARNLFYCPATWDACFAALDSPALGIELDVAHLPYVGIDPLPLVAVYAGRIKHVHLKDTRLDTALRQKQGVLGGMPHTFAPVGQGEIDFPRLLRELAAIGYAGFVTSDLEVPDLDLIRTNLAGIRAAAKAAEVTLLPR